MTVAPSPTTTADAAAFPRPFGKYLLVHPLGEGGMGAVYLAKASGVAGIEKLCVVKTLRPALVADDDYAGRFLDEARLVVQLAHRNICSVFDVGHSDGRYYLAMEHIAGRDVRALLARLRASGACLSEGAALHLMAEVLDALDYAHRLRDPRSDDPLRLVHRDVSPQNVMVNFEGEVKLIDFGLAVSTMKGQRTEPQSVMGKVAYMSPEQARGDPLDGRSDQFAAAIVLYETLTTQRYYGDLTPHQIWGLSGSGDYQPERLARLDEDIVALLRRALARHREERFSSCAEMREAIEAAQLARGVKSGDARSELRDRMHELFEGERVTEKHLLASLAVLESTGPAAAPPAAPDTSTPAAPSSSPSSPPSPSSASLQAWFSAAPAAPTPSAGEPTPTTTLTAADDVTADPMRAARFGGARRSSKAVAAGVTLALVLLVAVVGFQLTSGAGGEDASAAPAAIATTMRAERERGSAPPTPTPTPAPQPVEVTPPPAQATSPASADATDAEPADANASEHTPQAREGTPRAQQRRPPRRRAERAQAAKPAQPPTGYAGMLGYVKEWCRAEPCAREVLAHDRDMRAAGEPSTEDLLRAVKSLRACVERCAR